MVLMIELRPVTALWLAFSLLVGYPAFVLAQPCRAAYLKTRSGVVHTACQPRNRNCTILMRGLSSADKQAFLRHHNKLRSLVAMGQLRRFKPAANMYELVWDDGLAEVAQALADQCGDIAHDRADARFTPIKWNGGTRVKVESLQENGNAFAGRFRLTGQNLASERRSNRVMKMDGIRFIDNWFNEHLNYPPYQIRNFEPSFSSRPTGHFTQVIWATTQYLGCGFTMFRMKGDFGAMPYQKHYVCNYADSGNIKGRPVYAEGPTCSRCPEGSRCATRTGLCRKRKKSGRVHKHHKRPAGRLSYFVVSRGTGAGTRKWQHRAKCMDGGQRCGIVRA